jgi:hypothetical protein
MRRSGKQQRGAATLALTLAILLLGTLVVFSFAQAVLMQQKVANNATRAAQAFEAAEAGLHAALAYLADNPDRDDDGHVDPVFDTNGDGRGDTNTASIGAGSMAVATQDLSDGAMTRIAVTAHGYSDDRSASRTLAQTYVTLDPLPHLPRIPVTAAGALQVHGYMAVNNPQAHDAIWSGGGLLVDATAMFTIATPDATDANYPACLALRACATSSTTGSAAAGVVTQDATLRALDADALFRHAFSIAPAGFVATLVTRATTPDAFAHDAQLAGRNVIYSNGTTVAGKLTLGCREALTGNTPCPATARRPALVVIAADAVFAADSQLYGLLFTSGTLTVSGALHVHGALITAGDIVVSNGGVLDVSFDPFALAELHKAGPLVPLAGTWQAL